MLIFKIVLSIAFVLIGAARLLRFKPLRKQFEEFGLPSKYNYIVGGLEVLGGIALLVPETIFPAGVGLFVLLLGAFSSHLQARHSFSSFIPTLALVIGLVIVLYFEVNGS